METEHEGAQGLVLWRQPGHEHLPGQLMPVCGQSQWPAERRMGECQELLDEDEAAAGRRRTGILGWMTTVFLASGGQNHGRRHDQTRWMAPKAAKLQGKP